MSHCVLRVCACVGLMIALCGCSTFSGPDPVDHYPLPTYLGGGVSMSDQSSVLEALYDQADEWGGVDYRYGGVTQDGVDCSGLVYATFKEEFGLGMPRTTSQLRRVGDRVKKSQLRAGDLVFFSGSDIKAHVGIYLERGKFLHASTSKGVMISSMSMGYWKARYHTARRVR